MSASSRTSPPWSESAPRRGRLKVYLGYAAGVGKTYQMLFDGREAAARGTDLVIGYFEPHDRPDTIALAQGLEAVPRRPIEHRGRRFEEFDPDGVLHRHPAVCLVDELAHTNVPGAERPKRWQDVLVLLDAGIDVWTTVNIQHLESLNDRVRELTGVHVRETVPDWLVKQSSEVILVDVTPEALLNRLRRGVVYSLEMVPRALEGFFKESNLVVMREIAMREAAHEVDLRRAALEGPRSDADPDRSAFRAPDQSSRPGERILIQITADPITAALIRRGRKIADYLQGECLAAYVSMEPSLHALPEQERGSVQRHLEFARNLQIETRILEGRDPALALVEFARRNMVSQIYIARGGEGGWKRLLGRNRVERLVRLAPDLRVTVVGRRPTEPPT